MKITMLGTGHALVTRCYNTCFVLHEEGKYLLIDCGGGNALLRQLEDAGFRWHDMTSIFITHKHLDHIMGAAWMLRLFCREQQSGGTRRQLCIYGHDVVIETLYGMAKYLLNSREQACIGKLVHFIEVKDEEQRLLCGRPVTFFDIRSQKEKQFGFSMDLGDGQRLTCCGDEPYYDCEEKYAKGSKWLLHEAFCLYGEADLYHPYKIRHSTVKDAAETAERLGVSNLLLYHTEDGHMENRKELYIAEGERYFKGKLYVPYDLETVSLD